MATVADIIKDALKLLGQLAAGESLGANDAADGLRALNLLLGTWANERLHVPGTRRSTHVLTAALSPHTIGPSGTFAVVRPTHIDAAGIIGTGQNDERPLRLLTDAEYQAIGNKSETGEPESLWVEQTIPNARLWIWPVQTTAMTLVLYTLSRLTEFSAISDEVALPAGYEDALGHSLALRLAPAYGVEPSGALVNNATDAMAAIRRANAPDVLAELDSALLSRGSGGNGISISSGGSGGSSGGLF